MGCSFLRTAEALPRRDRKPLRFLFHSDRLRAPREEVPALQRKRTTGGLTPEEAERLEAYRAEWSERIMEAEPAAAFRVQPVSGPAPERAPDGEPSLQGLRREDPGIPDAPLRRPDPLPALLREAGPEL
jgi:hypothetical protein